MPRKPTAGLTDREAEIMAILWDRGEATAEELRQGLAGKPSANTVRTLLHIMAQRQLVADDGSKYGKRFRPLVPQQQARGSALNRLLHRFFEGSTEELLVHLVDAGEVDEAQLKRLQRQIKAAQKQEGDG